MPERQARFVAAKFLQSFDNTQRIYLALTSAGCVSLFMLVARGMGWPVYMRLEASLLASASPLPGIAAVAFGMLTSIILASLFLGRLRYEAGLFTACIGLAAMAARGGTVGSMLRGMGRPQIYRTMLMETVMLLGMLGLAWQLLALLAAKGWLRPEPPRGENELPGTIAQTIMATLVQATVTGLLIVLLAQVDSKKQIMAAVAIASMLGATAAHQAFPVRPSAAFWVGPFLTGIVGYAWAMRAPGQWMIGLPSNALAMASPLDYASLGTAGAIYGYWTSRQWREGAVEIELAEDALDD